MRRVPSLVVVCGMFACLPPSAPDGGAPPDDAAIPSGSSSSQATSAPSGSSSPHPSSGGASSAISLASSAAVSAVSSSAPAPSTSLASSGSGVPSSSAIGASTTSRSPSSSASLSSSLAASSASPASSFPTSGAAPPSSSASSASSSTESSSARPSSSSVAGTPGWHITTYFTAVETFFSGATIQVTGCLDVDCSTAGDPNNPLGTYPADFVDIVVAEGTGAISSGVHTGRYLNWSGQQPGPGYWLDDAPRDARGEALVPYVSAASHERYAFGTTFRVLDCGVDETSGDPMDEDACTAFKNATWEIRDRFEANVDVHQVDLYIGLQTQADMNTATHYVDQVNVVVTLPQ